MRVAPVCRMGQIAITLLSAIFFLSFVVFVLPRFPDVLSNSGEREWFIVSWNLPGLLMFVSNFRIQAIRSAIERAGRKSFALRITRWVRFWFIASLAFGALSLLWLFVFLNLESLGSWTLVATVLAIVLWVAVVSSSLCLALKKTKENKTVLENLLTWERRLLGITSFVFLIFTTFSSIAMSFPL